MNYFYFFEFTVKKDINKEDFKKIINKITSYLKPKRYYLISYEEEDIFFIEIFNNKKESFKISITYWISLKKVYCICFLKDIIKLLEIYDILKKEIKPYSWKILKIEDHKI